MKPGPTPTPPDDETPDPLLTTLRQRLSDYGQAPPPAAWAAIRQRVAAPPRPWWRRPRRLLPPLALLLGLLLVGGLAVQRGALTGSQAATYWGTSTSLSTPGTPAASSSPKAPAFGQPMNAAPHQPDGSPNTTSAGYPATTGPNHPLATTLPTATAAATRPAAAAARRLAPVVSVARPARQRAAEESATSLAGRPTAPLRHSASANAASKQKLTPAFAAAGNHLRRQVPEASASQAIERNINHDGQEFTASTSPANSHRTAARPMGSRRLRGTQQATQKATVATGKPAAASPAARTLASTPKTGAYPVTAMRTSPHSLRRRVTQRAGLPAEPLASAADAPGRTTTLGGATATQPARFLAPSFTERGTAIDLLALKQTGLLLPELAQPNIPAARPDSTPPAHAVRRWSVLVLAGPTLSYRTLGSAPTLAARHPDFARLERPALGLGAQVQVRRVLSGRWALAVGVGFHEYATQLALSVQDSGRYNSVHQRDTYRLLTVPVQLAYALEAPRGRLAVGLLLGAEPGWYVGGRSTEGSDCGCQQQTYPSATSSPYRALSVAFSLGLDLRYRVGGAASRWQWLVQPTGRYVATPFVRSEALGFTQRQPFSLGLLTGFSWDLR